MKTPSSIRTGRALALVSTLAITLLAVSFMALPSKAHGDVIYRQNFGNNSDANTTFDNETIDWKVLYSTSVAPDVKDSSGLNSFYIGVSSKEGSPSNLPNVHAPISASDEFGYIAFRNGASTFYTGLLYTEHFSIDPTEFRIDSIEWYAAGASGPSTMRAAVRIDQQWYVSQAVSLKVMNDSAAFSSNARLEVISFQDALWYELTAEIGSPFAISTTALNELPTGLVTAFGTLAVPSSVASSYLRADTYTIRGEAIPEPSSLAMAGMAVAASMLFGRAMRRSVR